MSLCSALLRSARQLTLYCALPLLSAIKTVREVVAGVESRGSNSLQADGMVGQMIGLSRDSGRRKVRYKSESCDLGAPEDAFPP